MTDPIGGPPHDPNKQPHNPGPPRRYTPDELRFVPAIFDSRYLAWRLWNPSHPQADDPDLIETGRWPRQQALDSCNILQLYHHLEGALIDYQHRYSRYEESPNVILMPNQILEPQPGWKILDRTSNKEYVVKGVMKSPDMEKRPVFDGRVILTTAAPPERHMLEWQDMFGERDQTPKCLRLVRSEETKAIMKAREPSAGADVADTRLKFVPIISYDMISHEPGGLREPFREPRQIKPMLRMAVRDPQDPRIYQNIYGWWMDTMVEFRIHAVGGTYADRLQVWLRNFFMLYTGVLKLLGVQQVLYWTTGRDVEESRSSYDLSIRNVQYYFRLEEIQVETVPVIGEINVALHLLREDELPPVGTSEFFPMDTSGGPLYGALSIGE